VTAGAEYVQVPTKSAGVTLVVLRTFDKSEPMVPLRRDDELEEVEAVFVAVESARPESRLFKLKDCADIEPKQHTIANAKDTNDFIM
jgi:hypothetical protein